MLTDNVYNLNTRLDNVEDNEGIPLSILSQILVIE
mgnify:FL=1